MREIVRESRCPPDEQGLILLTSLGQSYDFLFEKLCPVAEFLHSFVSKLL